MLKLCKQSLALFLTVLIAFSTVLSVSVSAQEVDIEESGATVPMFSKIEVIDGGIKFNWNRFVNNSYPYGVFYRIYYKNYRGDWIRMITTAATQYIDTDVHVGRTFTYTIRCVSPDGNEFASDFNSNGWAVSYYDAPVITSVTSKITNIAATGTDTFEEPTQAVEETAEPTETPSTEGEPAESGNLYTEETEAIEETVAQTATEFEEDNDSLPTEELPEEEIDINKKSDTDLAQTGAVLSDEVTDTIYWTGNAPAYRVYLKVKDSPAAMKTICVSTHNRYYTYNHKADGYTYTYKICALDSYGAVASECASSPYYTDGTLYTTRNRWIYELLSSKHISVAAKSFDDYSYQELSDAAHTYGALTPTGYFNNGVSLTRQFAANTLVNLFGYKAHSLGNYYNTAGNSPVQFTKWSSSDYYAHDTTNTNMNTVGYYGWFEPDSKNNLYPNNDVTADEWDNLMNDLSLYRTWHGKTVISFGDSGIQGRGNIVNKNGGSYESSWRDINRDDFTNKRFPRFNQEISEGPIEIIGEKYGMKHRDYSWSGASMGTELRYLGSGFYEFTDGASYKSHIANQVRTAVKEEQKADLIIMNGGDNDEYFSTIPYSTVNGSRTVYDWGYSAPYWFSEAAHRDYHANNPQIYHYYEKKVAESYTDETSFVDGTNKTFSLIKSYYPSVPVIYVRSHQIEVGSLVNQRLYQEKVLSIARNYGVKTVDLFNTSILDGMNKRIAARYCCDGYYSDGSVDTRGIHPNGLGYTKCYLPHIEDMMLHI